MKKYLLVIEKATDVDRTEVILKFKNIKFEKIGKTMYHIYGTDGQKDELNSFDYMSCISY